MVTSALGRPREGQLRLTRLADGEEALIQLEWRRERGRWLGRIEGEAPAGEYGAALELDVPFPHSGPTAVTVPGQEELRYTIEDSMPVCDVYLVPVAAEDGTALLAYDAEITLPGGATIGGADFRSPSVPVLEGHPRSLPFLWMCTAPGRRPACGRYEPDGGEGDVRIEVALERGWGAFLYVGGPDCEPLEGVRVLADGVPAGMTRPDGHLCLGGERPARLSFQYRDWQLDPDNEGEVAPDGSFDDSGVRLRAYLASPRR